MKKIFLPLALTFFLLTLHAQDYLVGSYNIRCVVHSDEKAGDVWKVRYPKLCAQINFLEPDIFGTQEASDKQLKNLLSELPSYAVIGVGRDDGKKKGEHSAIFYNKEKFTLQDKGDFWISPTPEKPTMGWDAACIRICSWGKFQDKVTKTVLYFFNLHLDHVGIEARQKGCELVLRKIKEIAGDNYVVLTGDFNSDQNSEAYKVFSSEASTIKDCHDNAEKTFAENGTFVAFEADRFSSQRIDHIFVSKTIDVRRYAVLTDTYWTKNKDKDTKKDKPYVQRTLSDHYPVFSKIRINHFKSSDQIFKQKELEKTELKKAELEKQKAEKKELENKEPEIRAVKAPLQ